MHGFEIYAVKAYPTGVFEGHFPVHMLRYDLKEQISEIATKVWEPLKNEFALKLLFPTLDHIQMAYEQYCLEFQA